MATNYEPPVCGRCCQPILKLLLTCERRPGCKKRFHGPCQGVSKVQYDNIVRKRVKENWTCVNCREYAVNNEDRTGSCGVCQQTVGAESVRCRSCQRNCHESCIALDSGNTGQRKRDSDGQKVVEKCWRCLYPPIKDASGPCVCQIITQLLHSVTLPVPSDWTLETGTKKPCDCSISLYKLFSSTTGPVVSKSVRVTRDASGQWQAAIAIHGLPLPSNHPLVTARIPLLSSDLKSLADDLSGILHDMANLEICPCNTESWLLSLARDGLISLHSPSSAALIQETSYGDPNPKTGEEYAETVRSKSCDLLIPKTQKRRTICRPCQVVRNNASKLRAREDDAEQGEGYLTRRQLIHRHSLHKREREFWERGTGMGTEIEATIDKEGFIVDAELETILAGVVSDYSHVFTYEGQLNRDLLDLVILDYKSHMKAGVEEDKFLVVILDGMYIRQGVTTDRQGHLTGWTQHEGVESEMEWLKEMLLGGKSEKPVAKELLSIMIRGVRVKFARIIAAYASSSPTGATLYTIISALLEVLAFAGLRVVALVADGASSNHRLFDIASCTSALEFGFQAKNRFSLHSDPLFLVFDQVHLLKNRHMEKNGKSMIWSHIGAVHHFEEAMNLRTTKLSFKHIFLDGFSKMNVRLAAQALSKSVGLALGKLQDEMFHREQPYEETRTYVLNANRNVPHRVVVGMFDIGNIRHTREGSEKLNPDLLPFSRQDDPRLDFYSEISDYFQSWDHEVQFSDGQDYAKMVSRQCFRMVMIDCKSIPALVRYLLEMGLNYVLTTRFNQDPLEALSAVQHLALNKSVRTELQRGSNVSGEREPEVSFEEWRKRIRESQPLPSRLTLAQKADAASKAPFRPRRFFSYLRSQSQASEPLSLSEIESVVQSVGERAPVGFVEVELKSVTAAEFLLIGRHRIYAPVSLLKLVKGGPQPLSPPVSPETTIQGPFLFAPTFVLVTNRSVPDQVQPDLSFYSFYLLSFPTPARAKSFADQTATWLV